MINAFHEQKRTLKTFLDFSDITLGLSSLRRKFEKTFRLIYLFMFTVDFLFKEDHVWQVVLQLQSSQDPHEWGHGQAKVSCRKCAKTCTRPFSLNRHMEQFYFQKWLPGGGRRPSLVPCVPRRTHPQKMSAAMRGLTPPEYLADRSDQKTSGFGQAQ